LLSVNVSGVEFRRGHVYHSVCAALEESGLEARYLSLEITESAIMNQAEGSIRELRSLRELGVELAIDDFGTGYSSLSYLKRLPLNKLKIDQSFVRGVPQDDDDVAITQAVIALAHSLQFATVAEGVETEAQRAFLKDAGCDQMQGFLKARPVSADEFEATVLKVLRRPASVDS
jgi:EAL domain-containing protein (putative c-di-GMP-specific phosphodiesterase class I)